MTRSTQLAAALILLGMTATHAKADLTITLGNATVAPGGTGTLDLSITSNNNDTLSAFSVELLITPLGATSFLYFTMSQADPTGNPDYVFAGHSFAATTNGPVFSDPYQTNYQNDTIIASDQYNTSTGYVTLPSMMGAPNSYLSTVEFQSPVGATLGDQFQVSLVMDPNQTYFDDMNGAALNFTTVGGLVTVAPSSVPEPPSLAMLALSGLGGLLWQWRTRRKGRLLNSSGARVRSSDRSGRPRGEARSWRR